MNTSAPGISLPPRYRMEGAVAAGGMAAVYAAHDTLLDRPVAVKVLAEHLNEDVAARERFQREARAAAGLSSHPGVVTIFDVGEHQGRSFIVMELFTGGTLADVLRAGRRPEPAEALRWLRRAAEALDAAHERGIVHRDIKPANLLLDDKGNLAVADFGIARLAWEEAVTQTGQILGTAAYISPEQAEGGTATAASDRYALACVAYELITGSRPFDGEHFAAQARAHIEDDPTPATARNPSLPRAVDSVLARGLAKDPAERWPSAGAFIDALEHALDGHQATTTDATRVMTAGPATAVRPERPAGARAAPVRRDRDGRPLILLALGLLALALIALGIASLGGGDGQNDPATQEQPRSEATAEPTQEPESAATEEPQEQQQPAEPSGDNPQQLNDAGYELYQGEQYAESVPYFRKAVDACGQSGELVCQYALYNLGSALHRSGESAEGIPFLQQRLERFPDNQPDVVRAELAAACEAAGQDCDLGEGGGNGKGKGKKKDKDD